MPQRIKNIWLLIRVLIRALFFGRADKMPKNISRIIVVPTGKLGDVVCTTPVFAAVRKHFPQAKIILYPDSPMHRELLASSGLVDEFGLTEASAALVTGPSFELAAPLYLAGIPFITAPEVLGGESPQATRPYKILTRFLKTYPYRIGEYAPRERLRCLEPLSIIENDTSKHLGFSPSAAEKVSRYFSANDFAVGITPTAGHKIKEWPEDRFAQVADYLVEKYNAKIFIIGGSNDSLKVNKVISLMRPKDRVVPVTDLNIDELKAFISKLNLFISVDTGPIYIAEAFNVPTIDITGPIDENEQPPRGEMHRNVVPPERVKPELFVLNAKSYNREEALRQVSSITRDLVEKEIDLLMKKFRQR